MESKNLIKTILFHLLNHKTCGEPLSNTETPCKYNIELWSISQDHSNFDTNSHFCAVGAGKG